MNQTTEWKNTHPDKYGIDQYFLEQKIWPSISNNHIIHSLTHNLDKPCNVYPFPSHKKLTLGSFVGERIPIFQNKQLYEKFNQLSNERPTIITTQERNITLQEKANKEFWHPMLQWLQDMHMQLIFKNDPNAPYFFSIFN